VPIFLLNQIKGYGQLMKMKTVLTFLLFLFISFSWAQEQSTVYQFSKYIRFVGRVVDSATKKPLEAASIQFYFQDTVALAKAKIPITAGGILTRSNGKFDLDSVPLKQPIVFLITAIGYTKKEIPINLQQLKILNGPPDQSISKYDFGDILLPINPELLDEVVIRGEKPFMELGVDRRIFNIDRSLISIGLMATDLMRNIPGLEVDIDGKVTLRNATPTFFIDGRPTTLTLDQIPADAVQRVEIITNPSAKFDASGGMAGILNIVLKRNRKTGYNGNLRSGIDSRAQINTGADVNINEGKLNFFANANFNQRKLIGQNISDRDNYGIPPFTIYHQVSRPISKGYSAFASTGLDWFMNKYNTITLTTSFVRGQFDNRDLLKIQIDSIDNNKSYAERNQANKSLYKNSSGAIGYKKLFRKQGMELTADLNYSLSKNESISRLASDFFDNAYLPLSKTVLQNQEGTGTSRLLSWQADFVHPLKDKVKIEAGVRAAQRMVQNNNLNYLQDPLSGLLIPIAYLNANFKYNDRVLAAYGTYAGYIGKQLTYQMGIRIESSTYTGTLLTDDTKFSNHYPLSLFPSVFMTYKMQGNQDVQFSYSRRITRPGFFQLMPFYDYQDSLNVQKGNPGLRPEFTTSLELNYNKRLKKRHTLLISGYYKHTTNLISRLQVKELNPIDASSLLVNTYVNARSAYAYGLEFSARNPINKWLEFSSTFTVYNSGINGTNLSDDLTNNLWSFTGRINTSFKFSKDWTMQVNSNYKSKTILPRGSTDVIVGGGSSFGAFVQTTAQGYVDAVYAVDFALRKEFLKDNRASLSLSISDVFRSRVSSIHSSSPFFIQDVKRRRDWQVVRLNFNWRFGKYDASLFKRKNQRSGSEGVQEGMQQMQQ